MNEPAIERLSHTDYNVLFTDKTVEDTPVEVLDIGVLDVPTDRIVVCDPLVCPDTPPLARRIEPGKYPVRVCVAKAKDSGERYAVAQLVIAPRRAAKWVLALRDGENVAELKDDREFFGFPVDAGLGSFFDQETGVAYTKFIDAFNLRHPDGNIYDDFLAEKFKENAKNPDDVNDNGDWVNLLVPGTDGLNVILRTRPGGKRFGESPLPAILCRRNRWCSSSRNERRTSCMFCAAVRGGKRKIAPFWRSKRADFYKIWESCNSVLVKENS